MRLVALRTAIVALVAVFSTGAIASAAPIPAARSTVAAPSPDSAFALQPPDPIQALTLPLQEAHAFASFPPVTQPDPVVRWMIDQVRRETVRQYAGDLSGEWAVTISGSPYTITTRNTTSGIPIDNATKYVGDHLAKLGLAVENHAWSLSAPRNVIGEMTGETRPADIYLVTAHLDDKPNGATAPGADDNASGSSGVLIAADILSQFRWNCTLRFALWTGEEQGLLGSASYAQRAKAAGENIAGVLNLDMIGWNTPGSTPEVDLHAKGDMPRTVDLANQMAGAIAAYDLNLVPEVRADGTGSSDHASFWKYGYDAILAIEDFYPNNHDFNPYYHTTSDKLPTLDLGYFTEFVRAAVAETYHMAGCLVTGSLHGKVLAVHDNSAITNAEIQLKDASDRTYVLHNAADGSYNQAIPPGTYSETVTAYGYETSNASSIVLPADSSVTQDFVLTAGGPSAPDVRSRAEAGEVVVSWPHVSPNTAYQVHRGTNPYFAGNSDTLLATVDSAHPPGPVEVISYLDEDSGAGGVSGNRFYWVRGLNAAGAGAWSNRTGKFDFALVRPAG